VCSISCKLYLTEKSYSGNCDGNVRLLESVANGAKRMQMPGGRHHDTSLDLGRLSDSPLLGDRRGRQSRPASRSSRTVRRYKTAAEAAAATNTAAAWADVDLRQNNSSEDNIDAVDVDGNTSTNDDTDNVVSYATLDRSRSRLNKFMDAVGKPFARKRSKSVDAVLTRRRPDNLSPPASTDDQFSHSPQTSGSTSMVTLTQFANGQIPGTVGIRNHGNTCFMNAVIQCLSNTEFFTEYFVTNEFEATVLAAQKAGRACAVTKKLNRLLSSLWTCDYRYEVSASFRAVVGQNSVQYQGTEQNDAQEFLQWLLDRVNEELYGTGVTNNQALYSVKYKVSVSNLLFQFWKAYFIGTL